MAKAGVSQYITSANVVMDSWVQEDFDNQKLLRIVPA